MCISEVIDISPGIWIPACALSSSTFHMMHIISSKHMKLPFCIQELLNVSKFIWSHLTWSWASLVAQLVKNLLQFRRPGFDPWVGKIPWRRAWQPTPVFLPGESMDRGVWRAIVHGIAQPGMTEEAEHHRWIWMLFRSVKSSFSPGR